MMISYQELVRTFPNSITSFIVDNGNYLSDFITSAGATIANAIVNDTVEFAKFLTGASDWENYVAASNENWSNAVHNLSGEWNTFTNSITA
ncbi:hypothetical protein [Klebsiella michiganensis]|uniref:hypothetical protein n=1 Tax=Klebsiella michiganensis TaxID=1134687 RepID=UPI001E457006|nr:hypothetical protein [Klebsiella michiganensis]UHC88753.1 hypothetical protein LUW95_05455 [Klebsiella michiganensis]